MILRSHEEKYKYEGPIYNKYDEYLGDVKTISSGVSMGKVISQIRWRLSQEYKTNVYLDLKYLTLVSYHDSEMEKEIEFQNRKCEICGRHLTTSGECPVCDLGEREDDI